MNMDGATAKRGACAVPSLPPPSPKSPPDHPDLYGKRRELAMLQMLDREIGFLQEELKSVGRIQTASRSCKEVADFVIANSDPLVTVSHEIRRPHRIWRWLCGKYSCFNLSWICCCCGCCPHYRQSDCSKPNPGSYPNSCWLCSPSQCCRKGSGSNCCDCRCPSCPDCSCACTCSCSKCTCCWQPVCPKLPQCSCIKNCFYTCCLCF